MEPGRNTGRLGDQQAVERAGGRARPSRKQIQRLSLITRFRLRRATVPAGALGVVEPLQLDRAQFGLRRDGRRSSSGT